MKPFSINTPMHVFIGEGEISRIPEILNSQDSKAKDVLVLTDRGEKGTGIPEEIVQTIEAAGFRTEFVDTVPQEPFTEDIDTLAARLIGKDIGYIVGVGGGSVLDTAKILSILLHRRGTTVLSLIENGVKQSGLPTLLIPTTAGTGSEATPNAIVAWREKQLKYGIVSNYFIPKYVVLDPSLTKGLPPPLTASTGVDALCHVLECYTSKKANPFSDLIALEGIRLITGSIRTAFKNGEDISARSNMLLGSFYGGVSIGSSSTTAVHALSYPLGGKYRIPHGVANAMLLVPVMEFNRDAISEKLTAAAKVTGIHSSSKDADLSVEFIRFLKELVKELQIPSSLSAFGIKAEAIPELTENALQVTRLLSNNPKPMGSSDITAIYETIR